MPGCTRNATHAWHLCCSRPGAATPHMPSTPCQCKPPDIPRARTRTRTYAAAIKAGMARQHVPAQPMSPHARLHPYILIPLPPSSPPPHALHCRAKRAACSSVCIVTATPLPPHQPNRKRRSSSVRRPSASASCPTVPSNTACFFSCRSQAGAGGNNRMNVCMCMCGYAHVHACVASSGSGGSCSRWRRAPFPPMQQQHQPPPCHQVTTSSCQAPRCLQHLQLEDALLNGAGNDVADDGDGLVLPKPVRPGREQQQQQEHCRGGGHGWGEGVGAVASWWLEMGRGQGASARLIQPAGTPGHCPCRPAKVPILPCLAPHPTPPQTTTHTNAQRTPWAGRDCRRRHGGCGWGWG